MSQRNIIFKIFIYCYVISIAFSYTADEVNKCILVNECKTYLETCQKDTECNKKYTEWSNCLANVTEKKSDTNSTIVSACDFENNTDTSQELKITCQTTTCSKYTALEGNSETFQNFMKCANFCFGITDDKSIPTSFASVVTPQYLDLYTYEAEEVDKCISTESTSECSTLISECENDSTCKASYNTMKSCLDGKSYCNHKYTSSEDNKKQRVTCPTTCSASIQFEQNSKFNALLQCFSYCYGYETAIYFPEKAGLDQYINLKKEAESFLPTNVDKCINSECDTYETKCNQDTACKNSYTLFSNCLNETTLCQVNDNTSSNTSTNSSTKLWDVCPTICSNNITSSKLTDSLLSCYQYCYGTEFDESAFTPQNKDLELYGDSESNEQSGPYSFDVSQATYLFTTDLDRAKSERQAIGSAVFILYLVYILFYLLNLNRKLNQNQFYYLESFLFLFGFSALMSVNYIQSGIFHAIFCYLTFICLLLIFASTVENNSICTSLNQNRKHIWLAALLFMFVWNIGNIANYYYVGSDHLE